MSDLPRGVRRNGNGYQARYKGPDGRRYARQFSNVTAATKWLADEHLLIDIDGWSPPDARQRTTEEATITVTELSDQFRESKLAAGAIQRTTYDENGRLFAWRIKPYPLAAQRVTAVTRAEVQRWRTKVNTDHHTAQLNWKASRYLHAVLAYGVKIGLIPDNPHTIDDPRPPRNREPRVLPPEAWDAYFNAIPDRWKAMAVIIATTGLRRSEAFGLRWQDLDLTTGAVTVTQSVAIVEDDQGSRAVPIVKPPKTRAGHRTVFIIPRFLPLVARWLPDPAPSGGLIWHDGDGNPIRPDSFYGHHRRAMKAIGHEGITIHELRNTLLTLAARQGATVSELQRIAGHSTPDMAMRYQVAEQERLRANAAAIGDLFNPPEG